MKLVTETEIVKEIARNLARINGGPAEAWIGAAHEWVKRMPDASEKENNDCGRNSSKNFCKIAKFLTNPYKH